MIVTDQIEGFLHPTDSLALVLEKKCDLSLRDYPVWESVGPRDVRIAIHTVGICGSDVHYYTHGAIGSFVLREPMILGHEASGMVIEVGHEVTHLSVGDRVCMEPGIPSPSSEASRRGIYNLDPAVSFWATPPVHGVLRSTVVHPANFTFKLPDTVSYAAGAMVEPLAIGVQACKQAKIKPGDIAVVTGAGPIGLLNVLAAFASGCAHVIVSDIDDEKLKIALTLGSVSTVNVSKSSLLDHVLEKTNGWGADVVFECSGHESAFKGLFDLICPAGVIVFVGIPLAPIPYDVAAAQLKEARVEHVFRYAHVFGRCVGMLASGQIDVSSLITSTFDFTDSIQAFEFAASAPAGEIKTQIRMSSD